MTYLIQDVPADELTDRHESLGPILIRVPGANFHRDCSAASNFLDILQTIREMCIIISSVFLVLAGHSATHALCGLFLHHKVSRSGDYATPHLTDKATQALMGEVPSPPGAGQLCRET